MQSGGYEFPEGCPKDCPGLKKMPYQGGFCHRCPIFNCEKVTMEDGEEFSLVEPDEYRKDWAIVWHEWFENGMKGSVELYF